MKEINRKSLTVDIALIGVFTAIICICSWLSIPTAVPVSLQTFAVFTAANVLGAKRSVISVITYIFLGVAGVPVFTGFRSGSAVILGPSGGFLAGFVLAASIIGIITAMFPHKKLPAFLSMFAGQIVCYICGVLWYEYIYLDAAIEFKEALIVCVIPFIIPDIIKITASVILSESVKRALKY